jgi:uncharacterized RDD family membrane protein YckC
LQNSQHPYGSAFRRFLAFLIDAILISVFCAGIDLFLGLSLGLSPAIITEKAGPATYIKLLIQLFYWPLFESSRWQATPGKRLCRLYVATQDGNRLSFPRAFIRNIAKALSVLTIGFGFLMIAITVRNQCLHDKIASAVVLKRT